MKKKLELSVLALDAGVCGLTLGILEVTASNAHNIASFKESAITTSALSLDPDAEIPMGAAVGDIFVDGIDVLQNYLDKKCPQIPEDVLQQKALQKLLTFLTSKKDHGVLYEKTNRESSVTLAQHLLSKLAIDSTYTIDSFPEFTVGSSSCLCRDKDKLVGKVGDTSYGCIKGWHGKPDIIMEMESAPESTESIPVTIFQAEDENDTPEDLSVSSIEVKLTENFLRKDIRQLLAQTIVFSFLQQKVNKGKLRNYLIPGIGIASNYLIVCFFDSENDVLLESKPVELFEGNSIRTLAVVFLWLTLNYRLFCSGITLEMKAMKSDFMRKLGDNLSVYTDDVTRPVHIPHSTQQSLYPWANEPVRTEFRNKPCLKYIKLPVTSDNP